MLTVKKNCLRLSALVLSLLLLFGSFVPTAVAEDDNHVRVLLTRLGSRTSISMELFGGYVVNGVSLSDGAKVNVKLSGGKISGILPASEPSEEFGMLMVSNVR